MKKEEIAQIVQTILIQEFSISNEDFDWYIPLEKLSEEFKYLSALLRLEQQINQRLRISLQLINQLATAFHTPNNLVEQ